MIQRIRVLLRQDLSYRTSVSRDLHWVYPSLLDLRDRLDYIILIATI